MWESCWTFGHSVIKADVEAVVIAVTELVNHIIHKETIPDDWKNSYIVNCYKGKGHATDRGNYKDLKLLEQVMKIVERVLEGINRSQSDIDNTKFGYIPGHRMKEKHLSKKKKIYFTFIHLEKALFPGQYCGGQWGSWVWRSGNLVPSSCIIVFYHYPDIKKVRCPGNEVVGVGTGERNVWRSKIKCKGKWWF